MAWRRAASTNAFASDPTSELSAMRAAFHGDHAESGGIAAFFEAINFVRSESMDLANDPRFFTDNVINYRIAAFSGLSVVSGLMLQNAFDRAFDMKKHMGPFNPQGEYDTDYILQLIGFSMLIYVILVNLLAIYIGVVQPYHTIRLMTAGAMGFEMSASYYLNKNVTMWRHFAIRMMLISLPIFAISTGFRFIVKFDRDNMAEEVEPHHHPLMEAKIEGLVFGGIFVIYGFFLYYVHWKHFAVFNDRYASMMTPPDISNALGATMAPRASAGVFHVTDV